LADDLAERAAERAEAEEADVEADLGDAALGLAQQEHRALDAAALQIAVRRLTERRLEGADEVRLGGVRHAREGGDGERLRVPTIHRVARPQHAAVGLLGGATHATEESATQLTLTVTFMLEWMVQTYLNVPFLENVFENVKPFLLEVAEPEPPLAGVTLCGTPPCVHFHVTLSPLWMLTEVGENALFLTATVLVEPACAGPTATAAPIEATTTAAAAILRTMSTPSESIAVPSRTPPGRKFFPSTGGTSVQARGRGCVPCRQVRRCF